MKWLLQTRLWSAFASSRSARLMFASHCLRRSSLNFFVSSPWCNNIEGNRKNWNFPFSRFELWLQPNTAQRCGIFNKGNRLWNDTGFCKARAWLSPNMADFRFFNLWWRHVQTKNCKVNSWITFLKLWKLPRCLYNIMLINITSTKSNYLILFFFSHMYCVLKSVAWKSP